MKIVKIGDKETKVTRQVVAKFGESVYHSPDVESVAIKVRFSDGSSIGFRRDEEEDEIARLIKEEEDEY